MMVKTGKLTLAYDDCSILQSIDHNLRLSQLALNKESQRGKPNLLKSHAIHLMTVGKMVVKWDVVT